MSDRPHKIPQKTVFNSTNKLLKPILEWGRGNFLAGCGEGFEKNV